MMQAAIIMQTGAQLMVYRLVPDQITVQHFVNQADRIVFEGFLLEGRAYDGQRPEDLFAQRPELPTLQRVVEP